MDNNEIDIKIKVALDQASSAKTLGDLKKSVRDLKGLALQAGEGTEGFNELTAAIGKTNKNLRELNEVIMMKSGNTLKNLVGGFKSIGMAGFAGFEVVTGAMSVFGEQTEDTMKKLVKLQGLMVLGRGLSELGEAGEKLSRGFGIIKSTIVDAFAVGNAALIKFATLLKGISFQGIISSIAAFGTAIVTFVTETAIPAIVGFFTTIKTMAATNPLGLILIAITAIVGALTFLIDDFKPVKALFEGIKEVVMTVIQAVKDFLDWLGFTQFAVDEAAKTTIDAKKKETEAINKRYDNEIAKAKSAGKQVAALEMEKNAKLQAAALAQIAAYQSIIKAGRDLTAEEIKDWETLRQTIEDLKTAMIVAANDAERSLGEQKDRLAQMRADSMSDGIAKDNAEAAVKASIRKKAQQKEIDDIKANYVVLTDKYRKYTADMVREGKITAEEYKQELDDRSKLETEELARLKEINDTYNDITAADAKAAHDKQVSEYKDYTDKIKKLAQDRFDFELALAGHTYEELKKSNDLKEEIALSTYTRDIKALNDISLLELKTGLASAKTEEDKITAKKTYMEAIRATAKSEQDQEDKIFKIKADHLTQEMADLGLKTDKQKNDSVEYKKLMLEYEMAWDEKEKNKVTITKKTTDEIKKAEDDLLSLYLDAHGNTLKAKYDMEKIKLLEQMDYEKQVTQDKLKANEIDQAEADRRDLDSQKTHDDALIKLKGETQLKVDELNAAGAESIKNWDEAAIARIYAENDAKAKAIQDAYDLEVSMGNQTAELDQQFATEKEALTQQTEDNVNAILQASHDARVDMQLKMLDITAGAMGSLSQLFKQGSKAAKIAALTEIGINTATGFMRGLSIAQESAAATGPAAVFAMPIFYATQIAAVLAAAARAKSILSNSDSGVGGGGSISMPSSSGGSGATPPTFSAPSMFGLGQGGPNPPQYPGQGQRVYVVESDITTTQNRVSVIQQRASVH